MGLFGSLYTGTSGMMANSRATSFISENIANSNTNGYKRSDASFHEIVSAAGDNFQTGGVGINQVQRVDDQGLIQQSDSLTDAAIAGQGFFATRLEPNSSEDLLFTREGSFREDSSSMLRNANGQVLYGWLLGSDGSLPSDTSLDGLVPIDLGLFDSQTRATSALSLSMNLDASQSPIDPHVIENQAPGALPVSDQPSHFSQTFSVIDGAGQERNLSMEFRKIIGPMAHFTGLANQPLGISDQLVGNPTGPTPAIIDGDQLVINDGAGNNLATVTFRAGAVNTALFEANTVAHLLPAIENASMGALRAKINDDGDLVVQATDPTMTLDISGSSATVLGAAGLNIVPDPDMPADFTYEPDADLLTDGPANPNQSDFPAFADTTNPNHQHWWEVSILTPDPADPAGDNRVEIRKGLINFDDNGNLNATPDANGRVTIDITTPPVEWDNNLADDQSGLTIDITRFSQFAGTYDLFDSSQDGVPSGIRTGAEIDNDGRVLGQFSNGSTSALYQIPIVTFANPNGLKASVGTSFEFAAEAGTAVLQAAGTAGAGNVIPSSVERSNVDIANEFSKLIVGQRAFSANSRLISTIDQMTQALASLKT